MLVTDDDTLVEQYTAPFRRSGWSLVSSTFIEDCARQLETLPDLPHVIVVDVYVRRKNEVDSLNRLRASRYAATIPLVLLGADRVDPSLVESFAAVLPRPASAPDLIGALSRVSG
jgi:DNA-binding response OmpR family regulator